MSCKEDMDTFPSISLWTYQETVEELQNKLWTTICELEDLKSNSRDELQKKDDNINQLIHLIKAANQERDEARDQLQTLLNKLTPPYSVGSSSFPASHISSPTIFDKQISPDLLQQRTGRVCAAEDSMMKLVFDRLAKKPLPEKGKLLEAVINAGPTLETLFVAGTLPQWRNPPPLKPFLIPSLSMGGGHAALSPSLILNCKRQKSQ